jgi:hypothetical protein
MRSENLDLPKKSAFLTQMRAMKSAAWVNWKREQQSPAAKTSGLDTPVVAQHASSNGERS